MTIGDFVPQMCVLCEKAITYSDTLWPDGGVQVRLLDFGGVAHRRCFEARYQHPVTDRWADGKQRRAIEVQGTMVLEEVGSNATICSGNRSDNE